MRTMQKLIGLIGMSLIMLNGGCGGPGIEPTRENLSGTWRNRSNGQITIWELRSDGTLNVSTKNPTGLFPLGSVMFMEDSKHWKLKGKTLEFSGKSGSSYTILKLTDTTLRVEAHLSINGRKDRLFFTRQSDSGAEE